MSPQQQIMRLNAKVEHHVLRHKLSKTKVHEPAWLALLTFAGVGLKSSSWGRPNATITIVSC